MSSKKNKINPPEICSFLEGEEMQALTQKHEMRKTQIRSFLNYIRSASDVVSQLNKQEVELNKWLEYINCSPMPKAYIPPDVHSFKEKQIYFHDISDANGTINWLLNINEISILSQDIDRNDLTRATLALTSSPNFSSIYDRDIDLCLKVIKRIEDLSENSEDAKRCGTEKLNYLKELKNSLKLQIADLFNRLTYRILCSEEAYMSPIDAISAEYTFQVDNFQMHIWSLKNVPIRFFAIEKPRMQAKLHGVNAILSIPLPMMQENFTIRAIHMDFDHVSENVEILYENSMEELDNERLRIKDFIEFVNNEWVLQIKIIERIQKEVLEKFKEYLELMAIYQVQSKKKSDDEGPKKKLKPPVEPGFSSEDLLYYVREELLQGEQEQYENYFNSLLVKVDFNEINMKKYVILGGTYQFYQVQKPKHYDFSSFNMAWHLCGSKLVIIEDLVISEAKQSIVMSLRKRTTRRTIFANVEEIKESIDPNCPWFVLTIKLPEYICYWGDPIVCQYETVTKIKEKPVPKEVIPIVPEKKKRVHRPTEHQNIQQPSNVPLPPVALKREEFTSSLLQIQQPSKESFFKTFFSNIYSACEQINIRALDSEGVLNIYDFLLDPPFSIPEIKHMQRHVLPRMISSFKFNRDIKQDEMEGDKAKKRTKTTALLRRLRGNAKEDTVADEGLFTLTLKQNRPERLFPVYLLNERIRFLEPKTDIINAEANKKVPQSFAELVKLVNYIKWWQKVKVRKLMDVKEFVTKATVAGKIKKPKRKRKMKKIESVPSSISKILIKTESSKKKLSTAALTIAEPVESKESSQSIKHVVSEEIVKVKKGKKINEAPVKEEEEPVETYTCKSWTTRHIYKSEYSKAKRTIVIYTDRLGYFGFAFKRYDHFPFKFWQLEPNPEDPENEVKFTIETQHVRCIMSINAKGINCYVTDPTKRYVKDPKIYFKNEVPITDVKELKQKLRKFNINIFAENDASLYIENGYFSEKHLATELHTYNCMAVNCTQIIYSYSIWNRLAGRRDMVLKFLKYKDNEENTVQVRITSENVTFVEINEICSNVVDEIELHYKLTWRNLGVSEML